MIKEKIGKKASKEVGKAFSGIPFSANTITTFSIIVAMLGSYLVYTMNPLGVVLLAVAFLLDTIDGAIARERKEASQMGAYLDGISDRVVEFFAILPLFFYHMYEFPALLLLFFGTCMTSFSKAYAHHREVLNKEEVGKLFTLLPRPERIILLLPVLLMVVLEQYQLALYLLWVEVGLSIITFLLLQYQIFRKACGC